MKKNVFMALAVMSVFIMGCAPAVGGDDATPSSDGIYYEDKNGETITISENGKTISNIKNASLKFDSGVTDFSLAYVKNVVIVDATLEKLTVESKAELSFVNTQIEELEANGDLVIKENSSSGSGRSARAANPDGQAEKPKVVVDKLVMKGNVEAGFGLYKEIERASDASDKYFEFPEESTARVENYDDGVNSALALSPVYEGFDGVKIDVTNKPANVPEKSEMDVHLKKGDMENQIFFGNNKNDGSNAHKKAIVEGDYFYWPFLEAGKEYELSITYRAKNDNGSGSKLLASKTVKATPSSGRGDVKIFLDENKGVVEFNEDGSIVWKTKPQIVEDEIANVSYELFNYDRNRNLVWITEKKVKTNCEGGAFDGFNIYKDGFYPALDDRNNIYNNKVFLIMNYNLESSDTVGEKEYLYSIHTPITKNYSNEITYDKSKYEIAFDVELDRENKAMKITVMPSAKTKALWKMEGATKLWFTVAQGETKVGESEMIDIDALPETPISLRGADLPSGALELQVRGFDKDNTWKTWIIKKTVE